MEIWCNNRKLRSYRLWKLCIEFIGKSSKQKILLRDALVKCFDSKEYHNYPAAILENPGSIKLILAQNNPLFLAFHDIVKNALNP